MVSDDQRFKFIDLFAGIGGFHLAMHENGGKCVFASEIDKFTRETYKANFKNISPFIFNNNLFNIDINDESLDYNDIPDFDILCAGFPCQPFSYAGKNEGFEDKTRGTLFFSILKILKAKKPQAFLLENVKGIKSQDKGRTLKTIVNSLESIGYNVRWEIIDSLNFGIPQKRERWYCVGFLDSDYDFQFPSGSENFSTLKDIIEENPNQVGLQLPKQEIDRINFHFDNFHPENNIRVEHDNSMYKPDTKKGKHGVYSYQKPDNSLRFHVGDKAKTQIQEMFYTCKDTYSPTIIYNRVPKLWDLERKLSVKECLRLQGFPDNFEFPVSNQQAYKQLGNSVALPVVKEISKKIIEALYVKA